MILTSIKQSFTALCQFIWEPVGAGITMFLMILGPFLLPICCISATGEIATIPFAIGLCAVGIPWLSLTAMSMFQEQLKGTWLREAIYDILHKSFLAPGIIIGGIFYLIALAVSLCLMVAFAPLYGIWWLFKRLFVVLFTAIDRFIEARRRA